MLTCPRPVISTQKIKLLAAVGERVLKSNVSCWLLSSLPAALTQPVSPVREESGHGSRSRIPTFFCFILSSYFLFAAYNWSCDRLPTDAVTVLKFDTFCCSFQRVVDPEISVTRKPGPTSSALLPGPICSRRVRTTATTSL